MNRPVAAFYAPLKSPDHPSPSGDRTMARLLWRALEEAGYAPVLASPLRSFEPTGSPEAQDAIRTAALAEARRLEDLWRDRETAERPVLWFTYHSYYKAPDWIGPVLADTLGIPYALAESTRAGKRAHGPWAIGYAGAERALDRADAIFVLTSRDREALARDLRPGQGLIDLPPFLDPADWPKPAGRSPSPDGVPRLLVVAMMRAGDKLASYGLLAEALATLADRPWRLDIAGDGPARGEVERLFASFGPRVRLHGLVEDRAALARLYAASDLLVWPACNEAFGMVLVEAQAQGCPVLAGGYGGVADTMIPGRTGLIAPPGDPQAFAACLRKLMADPDRMADMGREAARFVAIERSLARAAMILKDGLGRTKAP